MSKKLNLLLAFIMTFAIVFSTSGVFAEETDKSFTVTKRLPNEPVENEVFVGDFDGFNDCMNEIGPNDSEHLYTVYVNKDTTIPAEEATQFLSNRNVRITSGEGGPYTLTRAGTKTFITLSRFANFTIDNITIDGDGMGNFADVSGDPGDKAELTLDKGAIIQNFSSDRSYGVLYIENGDVYIKEGVVIRDNANKSDGYGIIYLHYLRENKTANLSIEGGEFYNNTSSKNGGVIRSYGNVKITGGTFKNNTGASGGAISLHEYPGMQYTAPKVSISGAAFEGNHAGGQGGAILSHIDSGNITIENSTFKDNASQFGGGIFVSRGEMNLENVEFEGNQAQMGGAIFANKTNDNYPNINIKGNSKFTGNVANGGFGGAIYTVTGSDANPAEEDSYKNLTINETVRFSGNKAILDGSDNSYMPPINYEDFENLKFQSNSFSNENGAMSKSLLNNADVVYSGEPKGFVKYEFVSGTDGETLPQEVMDRLPSSAWAHAEIETEGGGSKPQTITPEIITDEITVDGGTWTFKGWKPASQEVKADDTITFTGTWIVTKDQNTDPEDPGEEPDKPSKPGNSGGIILKPWDPTEPEEPVVEKGLHKEYMYGYPDHSFGPNLNITRAEAAAMISRLKNYDMSDSAKPNFADVESGWYNSAINAAVKNDLMRGYPDGSFKANEKITRAEFAQIIKNIDKANSARAPFEDVTGHWAEVAIGQAYGNGRIDGYPDGTFKPNNAITRAEVVKVANGVFDRKVDAIGLSEKLENPQAIEQFTDVDKSHWAYYDITEATNTHEFTRRDQGGVVENWLEVKEAK